MGKKHKLSKRCLTPPSDKAQKRLRKHSVPLEQVVMLLASASVDTQSRDANLRRMAHALSPGASGKQRRNLQASLLHIASATTLCLHTPYKMRPCKGCPALKKGPCHCALKHNKKLRSAAPALSD